MMRKMVTYPVGVSLGGLGAFLLTFAVVDFNRDVGNTAKYQKSDSNHLGEALEQLHRSAFRETMTFDNIRANRGRCDELRYLYDSAERKKKEFQNDPEFRNHDEKTVEALVATEFYNFAQKMCRRAMLRNGHVLKWLNATIEDELIQYYLLPMGSYFLARYFKIFDRKASHHSVDK